MSFISFVLFSSSLAVTIYAACGRNLAKARRFDG